MVIEKYSDSNYVLKKISHLIKHNPELVIECLRRSNLFIENPNNRIELVEKVSFALANKKRFLNCISLVISDIELNDFYYGSNNSYLNSDGKNAKDTAKTIGSSTASGAQSGGIFGVIAGAIIGTITASFDFAKNKNKAKINEEQYKRQLMNDIYDEPKTNWTPIIIVGGVLLVGGIVAFLTLKK